MGKTRVSGYFLCQRCVGLPVVLVGVLRFVPRNSKMRSYTRLPLATSNNKIDPINKMSNSGLQNTLNSQFVHLIHKAQIYEQTDSISRLSDLSKRKIVPKIHNDSSKTDLNKFYFKSSLKLIRPFINKYTLIDYLIL